MPGRIKLEQADETHHLNALIYGATGVGKTLLCGTAELYEPTSPALHVDFEGGSLTLEHIDVDVTRPRSWEDLQEIYDYFRFDNDHYRCILIDSLTEVQRFLSMGTILGEVSGSAGYDDLGSVITPTRQDWLQTSEQMRKFIRAFRDLAYLPDRERRVHVVMTALERQHEETNTVAPEMPGRLSLDAGAFVDILARLTIVRPQGEETVSQRRYLLASEYTDNRGITYLAKNRGGRLGKGVWDPTMEELVGPWLEEDQEEAEDEDPEAALSQGREKGTATRLEMEEEGDEPEDDTGDEDGADDEGTEEVDDAETSE